MCAAGQCSQPPPVALQSILIEYGQGGGSITIPQTKTFHVDYTPPDGTDRSLSWTVCTAQPTHCPNGPTGLCWTCTPTTGLGSITTDGVYTPPASLPSSPYRVNVLACHDGNICDWSYVDVLAPPCAASVCAPVFDPPAGAYTTVPLTVTMTSATPGASIYYFLNGEHLDVTQGDRPYAGPLLLDHTRTITARAFLGTAASANVVATFTLPCVTLENGLPVTGINVDMRDRQCYEITVPTGQSSLNVTLSGPPSDGYLEVTRPGSSGLDCNRHYSTYAECSFSAPMPGTWRVTLDAYGLAESINSGALTATYSR